MRIQQSLTDYINSQFAAGCHFRLQSFSSRRPRSFYISQHGQSAPRIALTLVLTKRSVASGNENGRQYEIHRCFNLGILAVFYNIYLSHKTIYLHLGHKSHMNSGFSESPTLLPSQKFFPSVPQRMLRYAGC